MEDVTKTDARQWVARPGLSLALRVALTLAPIIGEDLAALRLTRHDQRAFAFHARAIAEAA